MTVINYPERGQHLNARRRGTLRFESDLRQIGVPTARLRPYVLLDGKRPSFQLPLFPATAA